MKREEKKILTKGSILTKCKVKKRSGQSDALIYPFEIIHLKTLSLMQNKTSYKNRCKLTRQLTYSKRGQYVKV